MAQQVQELIDKIKTEGIQSANLKADEIKKQAQKEASQITVNARGEAKQIILEAENQAKKLRESTTMILRQASRDMLLTLHKEIEKMLKAAISVDVKDSLSSQQLGNILETVIKNAIDKGEVSSINISLSDKDLQQVKEHFTAKLSNNLKGGLNLKASDDIAKGFTISFDQGKSSLEFTDESLAGFLSSFVNTHISALLKESLNT